MRYNVGDKVVIVDEWCGDGYENPEGRMDCYLGAVMTVRREHINSRGFCYRMEEDHGSWMWYPSMIAGLAPRNFTTSSGTKVLVLYKGYENLVKDETYDMIVEAR